MEELIIFILILMFILEIILYKQINNINKPNNKKKLNRVHFYITSDLNEGPAQFKLWLDKPYRNRYTNGWTYNGRTCMLLAQNEKDIELHGLKLSDYNFLLWEDEPLEVFINLDK